MSYVVQYRCVVQYSVCCTVFSMMYSVLYIVQNVVCSILSYNSYIEIITLRECIWCWNGDKELSLIVPMIENIWDVLLDKAYYNKCVSKISSVILRDNIYIGLFFYLLQLLFICQESGWFEKVKCGVFGHNINFILKQIILSKHVDNKFDINRWSWLFLNKQN